MQLDRPAVSKPCHVCPSCEAPSLVKALVQYSVDPWQVVSCLKCRFVFLANPPEVSRLEEEFAWEKTSQVERLRKDSHQSPVERFLSPKLRRLKRSVIREPRMERLAMQYLSSGPVVDVGCGTGRAIERIITRLNVELGRSAHPIGIEVSSFLAEQADARFKIMGGYVVRADALTGLKGMDTESCGGAFLDSFLEHECRPMPVLRELRRVLRRGAYCLVKVPNYGSWNRILRRNRWCGFRHPDHVNYFTSVSLGKLAVQAGFAVEHSSFLNNLPTSDSLYAVLKKV